jgi:hypothetical protein
MAAGVLLLLASGCGGGHSANTGAATGATAKTPPQLKSIEELRSVFNSASREPTLVVLISPT